MGEDRSRLRTGKKGTGQISDPKYKNVILKYAATRLLTCPSFTGGHNAECGRQGDVIDLYIALMETERHRYIDGVSTAALQLLIMVEEGVFNRRLTDLEGDDTCHWLWVAGKRKREKETDR